MNNTANTNENMKAGRFLKMAAGRKLYATIQTTLADANGVVMVSTYTKATQYGHKHAGWFTLAANGDVYVVSGKKRVCVNLCAFRFGKMVSK